MAQIVAPLSEADVNPKTPSTITKSSSYKTSRSTYLHSYSFECDDENRFDPADFEIQSSPFPTDDLLQNLKDRQRSKSRSPTKHLASPRKAPSRQEGESDQNDNLSMDTEDVINEQMGKDSHESLPGDDTCLSTFSAVPNTDMTQFVSLGHSPSKSRSSSPQKHSPTKHRQPRPLGRQSRPTTPGTVRSNSYDLCERSPSPTPRGPVTYAQDESDDTTNLLDFTGQFDAFSQPSAQTPSQARSRPSPRKTHTQPNLLAMRPRSPEKNNLLDFDIPPAPTPRSVPAITVRDYEALKSSLNSQVSSLRATLEGRETEIKSLKAMKESAEARMGEVLEEIRDCRDAKAVLTVENKDLEKRSAEMRDRLRRIESERAGWQDEKADMMQRLSMLETRAEQAETKALAPSSSAGTDAPASDSVHPAGTNPTAHSTPGTASTQQAVELAVDRVARELHGLYKAKHEAKVTALKKSYASRWEKQVRELTEQLDESRRECEDMRLQREATFSSIAPSAATPSVPAKPDAKREEEEEEEEAQRLAALTLKLEEQDKRIRSLETRIADLEGSLGRARDESDALRGDLERERVEMGALVATVDEMLAMQQSQSQSQTDSSTSEPQSRPLSTSSSIVTSKSTGFSEPASPLAASTTTLSLPQPSSHAKSGGGTAKLSGLKGPGFGMGTSRIGGLKGRATSGDAGGGSGAPPARSNIMSNIERMGRGRG